jgi:hypothetical protein
MIFKHLDDNELYIKIPSRIVLDWAAAFVFLISGKSGHALAVLKAHRSFFRTISKSRIKRRELHAQYPSYSRENIHPGLIIFDYYFRRKKSFNA